MILSLLSMTVFKRFAINLFMNIIQNGLFCEQNHRSIKQERASFFFYKKESRKDVNRFFRNLVKDGAF